MAQPNLWLLVTSVACAAVVAAEQQPTFRAKIDSVQVDVRVVDQDGQFVRGLTRDDLQVYDDGQRQTISTFAMVDIPTPTRLVPGTPASDVVSNATPPGRLFVLVLDNYNTHPLRAVTVRQLAKRFVDHTIGDGDRVAIVAADGNRKLSHEVTANRGRLHAVIDRFQAHGLPPHDSHEYRQTFLDAQATLRGLRALAAWLGAESGRRKAIVFISEGIKYDITDQTFNRAGVMNPDSTTLAYEMRDLVTAATRANVSIYPIDARGLPTGAYGPIRPVPMLADEDRTSSRWVQDEHSLFELAAATGGIALVHSNEFDRAFDRIVEEASGYYLLGYTSSNAQRDGRFRRLEVRTTRPGLTVRSRSGYAPVNERGGERSSAGMSRDVLSAIQSQVPVSGLTMSVFAAPFRGGPFKTAVGVLVHASGDSVRVEEARGRLSGSIEVTIAGQNPNGRGGDVEHGTVNLQLRPETHALVVEHGVLLLSRLDLRPGRYQLRIGAVSGVGAARGSLHYDLDVPDYSKGPLHLSGIVRSSSSVRAPVVGDTNFWQERTPSPTTRREFSTEDDLVSFAEIYTNDQKPGQRIDVSTAVENDRGTIVAEHRESQTADMTQGKAATYRHTAQMPLQTFPPGSYVLTVRAETSTAPGRPVIRRVPIEVR